MALKYHGNLVTDTQVFAVSAGIVTTSYNIQKKSALAKQVHDGTTLRYIVRAGTPVPSNDENCIGIVFENWDVTEEGGAVPVAISGTVNEANASKLGIIYEDACKTALKNFNFLGKKTIDASSILLTAEPQTQLSAYAFATGLTYKLTLKGDTFLDDVADKTLNWIISLPSGFFADKITKTSETEYTITVKATNESVKVPKGGRVSFAVFASALKNGNTPPEVISDMTKA